MRKLLIILSFLPIFSLAQGPFAFFLPDDVTTCCDEPIFFTDLSTMGTSPIVSWSWDFGDGSPLSNLQNPTHVYYQAGAYLITLTVTDANGLSDGTTGTATICCVTAAFTVTDPICLGLPASFTDMSSSDPPGSLIQWDWDFGDGSPLSTLQNPTHTYANYGTYTVSLSVMDANGSSSQIFQSVFVDSCTSTGLNNYTTSKRLLKVTDILGRDTTPKSNTLLFYIYSDGTVEKKILIE